MTYGVNNMVRVAAEWMQRQDGGQRRNSRRHTARHAQNDSDSDADMDSDEPITPSRRMTGEVKHRRPASNRLSVRKPYLVARVPS